MSVSLDRKRREESAERVQKKKSILVSLASSKAEDLETMADEVEDKPTKFELKPPQDLNVDGAKLWLKAMNEALKMGLEYEKYSEEAYQLAIMWQGFLKRSRAGREVKVTTMAAISKRLYMFGLSPGNKTIAKIAAPGMDSKKNRRSRAQQVADRLRSRDKDEDE